MSQRTIRSTSWGTACVVALLVVLPGPLFSSTLVLEGGTVHPVSQPAFVGRVVITDGTITAVGADVAVPEGATRIDVSGQHVYPGMFDALSKLGLVEVGAVAATVDTAELGMVNAHLRAATAIHPASELIPVARANGLTQALVIPETDDGVVGGQASLVHLDGWTVEEMAIDPAVAMVVAWPEIETRGFDFATFTRRNTPYKEAKKKAEEAVDGLRDWFDAARHYAQATADGASGRVARDLRLESLAAVLDGGQTLVVLADTKQQIESALAAAEEYGLRIVIAGGEHAWKVKDELAAQDVPVILGGTQTLPDEEDDRFDRPFRTAGELAAAGVRIAFGSSAGRTGPHSARTLPWEVGMATAYGLDPDTALEALTLGAARILGVDDKLGSIEVGKIGNLFVTDGDPLEITTRVTRLVIGGREVSTENRHRSLYERYRARP